MKTILFDLDNTLYPEETYVQSGFNAVGEYLSSKYDLNQNDLLNKMFDIFDEDGRGEVFNRLINELELKEDVLNLVYMYRYHCPSISLYDGVEDILINLKKDFKLGLITDGRAFVQKRKVEALGIEDYFDVIVFTGILGEEFWKPSIKPFKLALNCLNSQAKDSFYVGDDPYKDFKAPTELGMTSIQIKYEEEMDYWKKRGYSRFDADICVDYLSEIVKYVR